MKETITRQAHGSILMTNVCIDKFRDVPECREAMQKAHIEKKELVEAVWKPSSYSIWGTGLTKVQTLHTKPEGWKGGNQLGVVLSKIMHDMFDDWSDSGDENEELSRSNELPQSVSNQDYRDTKPLDTNDDEEPMDESIPESIPEPEPFEDTTEEGEIKDTLQSQASNNVDSNVLKDQEVKPKHTKKKPGKDPKRSDSVGQTKSRSRSVTKRTNTSPLVGNEAKREKSESKPVLIAQARLKHDIKIK